MNYTNIFNRYLRVFPEAQFRSALREGKKLCSAVMNHSFRSVDARLCSHSSRTPARSAIPAVMWISIPAV